MQDDQLVREHQDACRIAQERFNEAARALQAALDCIARAEAARDMAERILAEQMRAASTHARALIELGAEVPTVIEDPKFYRAFGRGYEAGAIHAELEAIAAAQGIRAMPLPKAA